MGKGTLAIKVKNGSIMYVHDTLFVPSLKHNLISIGKLNSKTTRLFLKESFVRFLTTMALSPKFL
jgi:hypothetical protein